MRLLPSPCSFSFPLDLRMMASTRRPSFAIGPPNTSPVSQVLTRLPPHSATSGSLPSSVPSSASGSDASGRAAMKGHQTSVHDNGGATFWKGMEERRECVLGALAAMAIGTTFCCSPLALADFLSYDHADMRGADLSGKDLTGAVFAACDCRLINLQGSNLDSSTVTFAAFQGANLQDTSWVRSLADRVVFREANLKNANFTNAILSGSQFDGADITGADFSDAILDNYQRLKMCRMAKGTNPITERVADIEKNDAWQLMFSTSATACANHLGPPECVYYTFQLLRKSGWKKRTNSFETLGLLCEEQGSISCRMPCLLRIVEDLPWEAST